MFTVQDEDLEKVWKVVYNAIITLSRNERKEAMKITANFEAHSLAILNELKEQLDDASDDLVVSRQAITKAKCLLFDLCVAELTHHWTDHSATRLSYFQKTIADVHATLFAPEFLVSERIDGAEIAVDLSRRRCMSLTFEKPKYFHSSDADLTRTLSGGEALDAGSYSERQRSLSGHAALPDPSFTHIALGRQRRRESAVGESASPADVDSSANVPQSDAAPSLFHFGPGGDWRLFGFPVKGPTKVRAKRKALTFVPIAEWLREYDWRTDLQGDVVAGITTGIMLISQGMAYALLAGLPPVMGLYAAFIALIAYAIFGTSKQLGVGPVAIVALLTLEGLGLHGEAPESIPAEIRIGKAVAMCFIAAQIQFWAGCFGGAVFTRMMSHAVISGFTDGAALLISMSQLKYLVGYPIKTTTIFPLETIYLLFRDIANINWVPLVIGIACIIVLYFFKKINVPIQKKLKVAIPAPLVLCVVIIPLTWGLDLVNTSGLDVVGEIPKGLPPFSIPDLSYGSEVFGAALSSAIIAFVESYSIGVRFAGKHNYKLDADQELRALGLYNFFVCLFSGFTCAGSFSRSAVNDTAGMKTQMGALISAFVLLLTLLFLTPLFYYLPKVVLAAIILMAVINLIDIDEAKHLWHVKRGDFFCLAFAFLATLGFGAEYGILSAVALSLFLILFYLMRPTVSLLGRVPGTVIFRNKKWYPEVLIDPHGFIARLDADLYFVNAQSLQNTIERKERRHVQAGHKLSYVVLDGRGINEIDAQGVHVIYDMLERYKSMKVVFVCSNFKDSVKNTIRRGDKDGKILKDYQLFFERNYHALVHCYSLIKENEVEDEVVIPTHLNFSDDFVPEEAYPFKPRIEGEHALIAGFGSQHEANPNSGVGSPSSSEPTPAIAGGGGGGGGSSGGDAQSDVNVNVNVNTSAESLARPEAAASAEILGHVVDDGEPIVVHVAREDEQGARAQA